MWPLARLPYFPAYLVFQALMLAAAAIFIRAWPAADWRITLAAACWSLPLFAAFAIAQDVPLLLAAIAVALLLLKRGRHAAAGFIFSVCAIKVHLFLLVPVWIVARRMWWFAAGLLAGGAALVVLSLIAAGPGGFSAFLRVASSPGVSPGVEVMPNLNGLFYGNIRLELLASLGIAALVSRTAAHAGDTWALAATVAGSLLTSHHAYLADCALLLPALVVMFSEFGFTWQRYLALSLMMPFVYIGAYGGPATSLTRLGVVALCIGLAFVRQSPPVKLDAKPSSANGLRFTAL